MKSFLVSILIICLAGCADDKEEIKTKQAVSLAEAPIQTSSNRFSVEKHGWFRDENSHQCEIFIIKDLKTGKEYLGITGVGVSQMKHED